MSPQSLPKPRSVLIKPDFVALDKLVSSENPPYKGHFYQAMVGNVGRLDFGLSLVFCRFDISEEEMDRIYRAVQKLEVRYTNPKVGPDYPEYYGPSFRKVNEAYAFRNVDKFDDAIMNLLGAISCE